MVQTRTWMPWACAAATNRGVRDCKQARLVESAGWVGFPGMASGATVTVTMVMSDGSRYTAEGETTTIQPNGPDCEPTCVIARLTLDPRPGGHLASRHRMAGAEPMSLDCAPVPSSDSAHG